MAGCSNESKRSVKGDAVSLKLRSFEMSSRLCVCRWEVFTGAIFYQNQPFNKVQAKESCDNCGVDRTWRGSAKISEVWAIVAASGLRLRLGGPGRVLACISILESPLGRTCFSFGIIYQRCCHHDCYNESGLVSSPWYSSI